jgi:mannobiose 2-epimerase
MKRSFRTAALLLTLVFPALPSTGAAEEATRGSRDWAKEHREVLQQNILKFWIDHAIDRQRGGMIGWLDRRGKPIKPGTKSLVQQSRVMWSFSAAYRMFPDPVYKEVATHTLKFMLGKMWDDKHGGFYWLVDRDGNVRDGKKHLYGQSFAIYGLAEYARAFDDAKAREKALELFRLVDRKAHDNENGGYREGFSKQWQFLSADDTMGGRGRKSMNTHIHLLESFTTLYKATGDAKVRARVEELLKICSDRIVDSKQGVARLFFTDDWKPSGPDTSSYGHDIELSWLMPETAEALGGPIDESVLRASRALVEHTLRAGFDHEHGGVYDEGPAAGLPESKRMIWWVQAEALVGLLNAYQLFQNPEYWKAFNLQAQYTLDHFVDREYGEWHNTINSDGKIAGEKASEWKAPYHAARACLEVVRRLKEGQ